MKYLLFVYVIFLLFSCKKEVNEIQNFIDNPMDSSSTCFEKSKGFYIKYNCKISNFYKYQDAIPFDINNDREIDSVVILRPFYFNSNDLENECYSENYKNILLLCEVKNGNIFKVNRFDNVLSTESSFLGWQNIDTLEKKLVIKGEWGHSNKFYSNLYVNYINQKYYVDRINIQSFGLYNYNKTINLNTDLEKFNKNTVDSLKVIYEK